MESVEAGLGCSGVPERSFWEAAAGDTDMRALVSLGCGRRGVPPVLVLAVLSCQADPGSSVSSVWLAHRECGYSNGLRRRFVELVWNDGLVRERNGGFRADDLPAVGGGRGPMTDVRQPSQKDDW